MLTHLHNHFFSKDSVGQIDRTAKYLASKGFKAVALTDHGSLSGVIAFSIACKQNDIKPILGNEVYLAYNNDHYHLTLLAKNQKGYENLVKLNNLAKSRAAKRTDQVITFEDLFTFKEGVIVLSGCPASPFQQLNYDSELKDLIAQCKFHFGRDFYCEAQFLFDLNHYNRAKQIADDFDLEIVVTNDCHYANKKHSKLHYDYCASTTHAYNSSLNYFVTEEELIERVKHLDSKIPIEKYIENANRVGEECEVINLEHKPEMPEIEDADNIFRMEAIKGLIKKGLHKDSTYTDRLEYEMQLIVNAKYSSYFLIVKDLIDFCRRNNIAVGPGRGSAAGSLATYCLEITNVDPIEHDLMFERFINPERVENPDIDTDTSASGRPALIEYANQKYGALQIAAYDTWGIKSILNKFGGVYKVDETVLKQANEMSELITQEENNNVRDDILALLSDHSKDLCDMINLIEGSIKGISRHAGGIAIVPKDMTVPFEIAPDGTLIMAFSEGVKSKDLQYAGIVKFDFLGLLALDILEELERITGVKPPKPVDNDEVFKLFREGKTTGIFQFTSAGCIEFTKQVAPVYFDDIVHINALYRKGTLLGGTAEAFLNARNGKTRSICPEIDEILSKTNGSLVYQEDVMKVYAWACDKNFGQADFARKTLVKYKKGVPEKEKKLLELQKEMMQGFKNKGLLDDVAAHLWEEIKAHSLYSFNRSHAVAYAMIAWQMAWYKYYYPLYFFTAALNNRPDDEKQEFIIEILSEGYEIITPNVNISSDRYETDGEKVYMPLDSLQGVGVTACSAILQERKDNGLYKSCQDFVERVPARKANVTVKKALYDSNAFPFDDVEFLNLKDYTKPATIEEVNYKYLKKTQIASLETIERVNNYNNAPNGFGGCVVDKESYYTSKSHKLRWRYYLAPNRRVNHDKDILQVGQWVVGNINTYKAIERYLII